MKFIQKARIISFYKKYQKNIWSFLFIVVILIFTNVIGNKISNNFNSSGNEDSYNDTEESVEDLNCNVQGINIHGEIYTYHSPDSFNDSNRLNYDQASSEEVLATVSAMQSRDNIKAIIIEIDSSGGSGVAGEEIMRSFKDSKKPVIAFIRGRALSAGYMAATGAETIFASRFSDVGGIGVTMSYLQNVEKNKKAGLEYITLSSGKYKDSGSPDRALTQDEKNLFMRDVKIGHEYFLKIVSENRKLDINKVRKLSDGSSIMGEEALKNGLIDNIGLYPDVVSFVSEKIGEEAKVCW